MKRLMITIFLLALVCGCSRTNVVIDGEDLSERALEAARASGYEPSWFKRDTLRIYSWEDFIAPHAIASFEKALGVKVVIDTFSSNEDMFEDLQSRKTNYDILTPSSYIITGLAKAGLIVQLNHRHLPNVRKNFDKSFKPLLTDPRFTYNVPYTISYTGLHFDRNALPAGADPESLGVFGHAKLAGRTALFDDMRELLGAGLMRLGYSLNSTNPTEIKAAADEVVRWRKLASRTDDDIYKDDVATGAVTVAMSYSDQAFQSINEETAEPNDRTAAVKQAFTLPREGFSIGVDEFVITANGSHRDLAYAFINYIYDAEVARSSMEWAGAAIPVKPAIEALGPELRQQIILTPEQLKRGQVIMDFENRPKVAKLYEEAWARIEAAN